MRKRLAAVAMTYWTRPFVWVFGGLGLLLLLMATLTNDGSPLDAGHAYLYQGVGLFSFLLGFHASSQFSQYASHLTPGFDRPHQVFAVAITLGMAMMVALIGVMQGYALLPCLGLIVTVAAVFVWFGYLMASQASPIRRPHTIFGWLIGIVFGAVIGGGAFVPMLYPNLLETFLDGGYGLLSALFLLATGLGTLMAWATLLPGEAKRFAASGATTAFTWKDHQQRMMRQASFANGQPTSQWIYGASDRFLTKMLSSHRQGRWGDVRLRLAGTTRTFQIVIFMAIAPPLLIWVMLAIIFSQKGFADSLSHFLGPMSRFWMVMFVINTIPSVGGVWRQRLKSMSLESLWPTTRRTLRREMFLCVMIDFTPIAVCSLMYILILISFGSPEKGSDSFNTALLCGWLLIITSLYAFVMWAIIQQSTVTILSGAIVYYLVAMAVMTTYLIADLEEQIASMELVLAATSVLQCAIAVGIAYVWRRWRTVEFGMLDR